jgi:hypothetical protein
MNFNNNQCHYCAEEAYEGEQLEECKECDFKGHYECLSEHCITVHECTDAQIDDTPNWDDDYLGGTEEF